MRLEEIWLWPQEKLFRYALGVSFFIHFLVFVILPHLRMPDWTVPPVEIDLTMTSPLPGSGPAKLGAPKKLVPNAPKVQALPDHSPTPAVVAPVVSAKDWVLPTPGLKKVVAPPTEAPVIPKAPQIDKPVVNAATPGGAVGGTGTSALTGGSGRGADIGTPNGTGDGGSPVLQMPKLLNLEELLRNLRKLYPEAERAISRQGHVLLAIHIGADGLVTGTDLVRTSGADDFDQAAQKAAKLMRFSPAKSASGPVPVKVTQPIDFLLEN